ncbi:hypothetical protein LENED_000005 [Lentinula edodes]|uniref:Uncharacterized protein n=1 Tax=Lentinula edodes TaxID=5353 RepID=A0A1Q3DUL6_LENED|nr:hypothetical protein LENED_000005 [Lentinula edodes]
MNVSESTQYGTWQRRGSAIILFFSPATSISLVNKSPFQLCIIVNLDLGKQVKSLLQFRSRQSLSYFTLTLPQTDILRSSAEACHHSLHFHL